MFKDFFILDIKGGTHNKYGNIAMIYANPIMETETPRVGTVRSVIDHYCNDTETFIIPEDDRLIQPIITQAQLNQGVWQADLNDFVDEITFNETFNKRVKAHLYRRFCIMKSVACNNSNNFTMPYHLKEVDFNAIGNFRSLGENQEEIWTIGDNSIETPHGTLKILDAIFVDDGPLVGVQFSVDGYLRMNDFSCSNGNENTLHISTFAILRKPYNAWLWVYAFDEDDQPIVNFCGFDNLDGLANFKLLLKHKYQKK